MFSPKAGLVAVVAIVSASTAAGTFQQEASTIIRRQTSASDQRLELAPNPACPDKAPYCRTELQLPGSTWISVMGFHNGVLYAWVSFPPGYSCPVSNLPPDTNNWNLCFYSSSTFAPESWSYLGQYPTATDDRALEIVFGPGACSLYKYIYTSNKLILRASSAPTDWDFTDIASHISDLPANTLGFRGNFAAADQGSRTRLFYGNYNDPDPYDPGPGCFIWHSDNCGETWTTFSFGGGRHVQGINADPEDSWQIYASVDTIYLKFPNPWLGLWRSTDGGDTFDRVSTNYVGIDFVFPRETNKVFLETDNDAAFGGPLLSWDKLTGGDTQIAAPWPSVPVGAPEWAGSAHAIILTSEQNIMLESIGESGFFSWRNGLWYFAPPSYDTPVLLEDLQPPIDSIETRSGIASVVTFEPHGIQPAEIISIIEVNPPSFDATEVVATVTGPYSFTYPCEGCPENGSHGFATKSPFLYPNRTVEVTDPNTQVTYLYSNGTRIPKPRFLAP